MFAAWTTWRARRQGQRRRPWPSTRLRAAGQKGRRLLPRRAAGAQGKGGVSYRLFPVGDNSLNDLVDDKFLQPHRNPR